MWPLNANAHKIAVYNNNYYKNWRYDMVLLFHVEQNYLDLIVPLYSIYAAMSLINDYFWKVFMEYLIIKY